MAIFAVGELVEGLLTTAPPVGVASGVGVVAAGGGGAAMAAGGDGALAAGGAGTLVLSCIAAGGGGAFNGQEM